MHNIEDSSSGEYICYGIGFIVIVIVIACLVYMVLANLKKNKPKEYRPDSIWSERQQSSRRSESQIEEGKSSEVISEKSEKEEEKEEKKEKKKRIVQVPIEKVPDLSSELVSMRIGSKEVKTDSKDSKESKESKESSKEKSKELSKELSKEASKESVIKPKPEAPQVVKKQTSPPKEASNPSKEMVSVTGSAESTTSLSLCPSDQKISQTQNQQLNQSQNQGPNQNQNQSLTPQHSVAISSQRSEMSSFHLNQAGFTPPTSPLPTSTSTSTPKECSANKLSSETVIDIESTKNFK